VAFYHHTATACLLHCRLASPLKSFSEGLGSRVVSATGYPLHAHHAVMGPDERIPVQVARICQASLCDVHRDTEAGRVLDAVVQALEPSMHTHANKQWRMARTQNPLLAGLCTPSCTQQRQQARFMLLDKPSHPAFHC